MAPPPQQTIQQQNEEIIKELRAIRQLLERLTQPQPSAPPQPTTAKVTNLKGYALGKADAPLTMVEFTDLQCPFCNRFAVSTFDQLKKDYIDTGKVRFISRDYPLDFHPQAMTLSYSSTSIRSISWRVGSQCRCSRPRPCPESAHRLNSRRMRS